jgi:hypothetical protein
MWISLHRAAATATVVVEGVEKVIEKAVASNSILHE